MKTAMQQLFEWLENSSDIENDILDWETVKTNALEKEKEQIMNAMNYSTYREMKGINVSNEEYYYDNYNQSIKKITITENNNQPNL